MFSRCLKALISIILTCFTTGALCQNDQCSNASVINIPDNGFGIGTFSGVITNISSATIEPGETFAPAIVLSGQTQKSVWYKFTIPTPRSIRVTLAQSGSTIASGDVGFTVYKSNSCLPAVSAISTTLTPIGQFGSTFHPCIEPGNYLVQVSAKSSAMGSIYITIETEPTNAVYDSPAQAYDFGTINEGVTTVTYNVGCQSTENAAEVCTAFSNPQLYNKSTWHVFRTAAYHDYVALFLAYQNSTSGYKVGYSLYQGDVRNTPINMLTVIDGCDSLAPTDVAALRFYQCSELAPNTIYSIQLFYHQAFNDNIQVTLTSAGVSPTQAPEPVLAGIPASNSLGVLPSSPGGIITTATDQHGCNSRHIVHPCDPSLPANGVIYDGLRFNLSTFYTFSLATASNVGIDASQIYCSQNLLVRLYKQAVTNSCSSLDTSNLISTFIYSNNELNCLEPGNYTLQISGSDSLLPPANYSSFFGSFSNSSTPFCGLTGLGQKLRLNIKVRTADAISNYSLNSSGAFDPLNQMQPLVNGINYNSTDTFGCANTVLPLDTSCSPSDKKALYREFVIADSAVITLLNSTLPLNDTWSKLYFGDANALATAQNAHTYPLKITGLTPYTKCIQYNYECEGAAKVCAVPGTYTYVSFGSDNNVAQTNLVNVRSNIVTTIHDSPSNAEDMGDILSLLPPTGGNLQSAIDHFSCKDNAVPINGFNPCEIFGQVATKAIYRQFFLSAPANISITGSIGCGYINGPKALFYGRATDGISGLTVLPGSWQCFTNSTLGNSCLALPAGWYTLVSYGIGPSYATQSTNTMGAYQTSLGLASRIIITVTVACPGPKYNRPYKAAVDTMTGQPFLIDWALRTGSTVTYPRTDTTYLLYRENYNCTSDIPFTSHPVTGCVDSLNKVTYYVFRTVQESYLSINTKNYWGVVYAGDVRTDSASFASATPVQPCIKSYGKIQICRLVPGTYTLVVFAFNADNCTSLIPEIYIDKVGYSRFDFADKAYDFGVVPPDSVFYSGKPGDVNPQDPGRAPSDDLFYCTTGAAQLDPNNNGCASFNPAIYNTGLNNYLFAGSDPGGLGITARRNLWYTFLVAEPGTVRVKVSNKTSGKTLKYKFAVYKSNVSGSLPFPIVVNTGEVDSTLVQGLTLIKENTTNGCTVNSNEVSFFREPCGVVQERYYILVDNPSSFPDLSGGMHPNSQLEVAVMVDSVELTHPGDYCNNPVIAGLSGPGVTTSSVTIDCHGIGTDYGEFLPTLSCPPGANTTDYKTSWFRIDITGTDTLDVTTFLTENTTALPSQIKYRLMNGDCGAMQERSCVQDAETQDTYRCLPPGSYYLQVFIPKRSNVTPFLPVTGSVTLNVSAVSFTDTCAPVNNCLAEAVFVPQFDCTVSDYVTFLNYSTFGSAMEYQWDFGYNGQGSTDLTPQFSYPVLPADQTYTVTLNVLNTGCGGTSTFSLPVTIPARPDVNLGNDTTICQTGGSLILNATSLTGASYNWQNTSTGNTYNAALPGSNNYWVTVTYNGCPARDTINVSINPILPLLQNISLCNTDSVALNSYRGFGESYSWNTGSAYPIIYTNTPGTYVNIVNWSGCIIRDTFNISISVPPILNIIHDTICSGQNYILPWGTIVNAGGTYHDTLRFVSGCDSLRTTVILTGLSPVINQTSVTICSGLTYTLPWGEIVSNPGTYSDTLFYSIGCDSLIRIIDLSITPALVASESVLICSDEIYILPWGIPAMVAGIYSDTIRTSTGCDSLIRSVTVNWKEKPLLQLSKSNDIDCSTSTAKLTATGGSSYSWTPSSTLSDPSIGNPIASPTSTTLYTVSATGSNGCAAKDSITVTVNSSGGGLLIPSSFSPNNDGLNDCFRVTGWGRLRNYLFTVYNRWGQIIFRTPNPALCWDGRFRGKTQGPGTYVYQVTAMGPCGKIYKKGTVVLIR